ncbi:hypothetical protein FRC12_004254, partial [Ceratobasidium sp. 428]
MALGFRELWLKMGLVAEVSILFFFGVGYTVLSYFHIGRRAPGSPLTPSSTPTRTTIHIALQLYRYLQRFDPFYSLELENDLNYYRNLSEVQEVELEVLLEWQQEALQTFQRDQQIILELEEPIH